MTPRLLLDLDAGPMVPPFADRVLVARTATGAPALSTRVLVFETAQGVVLIDTGFGTADVADPRARLGRRFIALAGPRLDAATPVRAQLDRAGVSPSDVRHILMTHLDLDHTGGLADFPHATVHVHPRERAVALSRPKVSHKARYRTPHFAHAVQWAPLAFPPTATHTTTQLGGLPFVPVEGLPAFHAVELTGHTPGHTGYRIETDGGEVLQIGDAVLETLELVEPGRAPSVASRLHHRFFDDAPAVAAETRHRLRTFLREAPHVRVVSTHDPSWVEAR